jgi:hypothetical protein
MVPLCRLGVYARDATAVSAIASGSQHSTICVTLRFFQGAGRDSFSASSSAPTAFAGKTALQCLELPRRPESRTGADTKLWFQTVDRGAEAAAVRAIGQMSHRMARSLSLSAPTNSAT